MKQKAPLLLHFLSRVELFLLNCKHFFHSYTIRMGLNFLKTIFIACKALYKVWKKECSLNSLISSCQDEPSFIAMVNKNVSPPLSSFLPILNQQSQHALSHMSKLFKEILLYCMLHPKSNSRDKFILVRIGKVCI